MNNMTISLAYDPIDKANAGLLAAFLNQNGFVVKDDGAFEKKGILALVMTSKSQLEKLMKANPWVKDEFSRSSTAGLRVLPLLIYDSSEEKLDDVWTNAEKIYAIMSEEFKPYAYDIHDLKGSLVEFKRVIKDEYEE
jgi:hypothetical protein